MRVTYENFIQYLTTCVDELTIALARLEEIEIDSPATHDELLRLNGRIIKASGTLPEIIQFVAVEKPSPALVGDKLSRSIELLTSILKEKIRILNNTPQVFKDTNDMTHLN